MTKKVSINLSKSLAKNLLKDYQAKVSELEAKISDMQNELEDLNEITEELIQQLNTDTKYNSSWPRWQKVEYALKCIDKASTVSEIIDELKKYEPELLSGPFHSTLSQKVDSQSIFFRLPSKLSGSEYLYGLCEWLDNDGRVPTTYYTDRKNVDIKLSNIYIK